MLACGRRWGKSELGKNRLLAAAQNAAPVAWFSPTYKMLAEIWRDMRILLAPITARANSQEHRLELLNGAIIDMWSLDSVDAPRGRKYKRVVIDEAAMIPALADAWQAVIRPTLADYEGDAWFLSTPKGRNFFWQTYQWGSDRRKPDWMSWQFPTASNPYIKTSEVDAMRAELPERIYMQEVLAQFLDSSGGVFRRVRDAATATRQDAAMQGHQYVVGCDWGRSNDFTVISVIDTTLQACVHVDRFNQIDYAVQRGRLKALHERFRPTLIMAELNSIGQPIVEQLQRDGLPVRGFTTTLASKMEIIEALALAFEQGKLKVIPDETLIGELEAYEQTPLATGVRYAAPSGMHDDCVMSLALAWSVGRRLAGGIDYGWGAATATGAATGAATSASGATR